jgi:hypothetical protein
VGQRLDCQSILKCKALQPDDESKHAYLMLCEKQFVMLEQAVAALLSNPHTSFD